MKDWSHYINLLKEAESLLEEVPHLEKESSRAQLFRQFAMNLSQGYFLLFQSTPEHPEFAPFENSVFLAQPNPDGVYYYAPVDDSGTYRVTGSRGTAPVAGFAIGNRIIGMAPQPGKGFGSYDMDDLTLDDEGHFDVLFSVRRPAGYEGDWLPLQPETDFILVRQFSYDWGREQDIRIAIERIDTPPLRPTLSTEEIDSRLVRLFGHYVRNLSAISIGAVNRCAERGFINRFNINSFQELGNGQNWPQAYWETVFDIAEDEALIIETDLPENRPYWNVQVIDALWNQVDYVYRQSSLNGLQAAVDSDGRFRAVLSHQDPGIANWLDTGGNLYGMLIGRWYRCSSHPLPAVTKVKFMDLEQHLSRATPRITGADRANALRQRRIGAQLRRKW